MNKYINSSNMLLSFTLEGKSFASSGCVFAKYFINILLNFFSRMKLLDCQGVKFLISENKFCHWIPAVSWYFTSCWWCVSDKTILKFLIWAGFKLLSIQFTINFANLSTEICKFIENNINSIMLTKVCYCYRINIFA